METVKIVLKMKVGSNEVRSPSTLQICICICMVIAVAPAVVHINRTASVSIHHQCGRFGSYDIMLLFFYLLGLLYKRATLQKEGNSCQWAACWTIFTRLFARSCLSQCLFVTVVSLMLTLRTNHPGSLSARVVHVG